MKSILFITVLSLALYTCKENKQPTNATNDSISEKIVKIDSTVTPEKQILKNEIKEKSEEKKEYFKLLSSTYESWVAGIPNGGSGTEYYFKTAINTGEKIQFDSLWLRNKSFSIFITKGSKSISDKPITFSKGDTIILRVSDLQTTHVLKETKPPVNFEGAALIGYSVNGKREYYTVREMKKQNTTNRP